MADTRKPLLLLVSPRQRYRHYATQIDLAYLMGKKTSMSSLALATLAALTPDLFDIRIIDEEICPVPAKPQPALVGITTLANTAGRAYEIADGFRERGVPVVLGGPHVTYRVEEGLQHADAVVIGEAELVWHSVLADWRNGRLQKTYQSAEKAPFRTSPMPRWDLIDTRKVLAMPVQASRGCPYKCEFCIVTKMFGNKLRYRDVGDIVKEVSGLPVKRVLFVDDNLTASRPFAWELVKAIKPLGIAWTCQASIDIAFDRELLAAMADAGCVNILVGFESFNPDSLHETRKVQNRDVDYADAVRRIHAHGMHVFASFAVGFDGDTIEDLDRIYDFAHRAPLLYAMVSLLGCAPGSDLYRRMEKQGRLCDVPSHLRGGMFPSIRYRNMGQAELFEQYFEMVLRLHSFASLKQRALTVFGQGTFTRPSAGSDMSFARKLFLAGKMTGIYLLTRDRDKRELFAGMIRLAMRKKASMDAVVVYLFAAECFNRHLTRMEKDLGVYRAEIARLDRGPWKDRLPTGSADGT